MQFSISFRHMDPSDGVKTYVEKKLIRLSRFSNWISDIKVVVSTEKKGFNASFMIKFKSDLLKGKGSHEDMYAAIDLAIDVIERRITKEKDQITGRKK